MALWDKYEYRPGLTFGSKFSACQYIMRPRRDLHNASGDVYDVIPELVAEFATFGGEYSYTNPDGIEDKAAHINGHFFDLDAYAEAKGLTDEEREFCAKRLLWGCDQPFEFWLHSAASAPLPWPKYDEAPYAKIGELAETLGYLSEALAYEQQNKDRPSVVKDLSERIAAAVPEAEVDDSLLTAA